MAEEACPAKWRDYVSQLAQQHLSIYPKELQEVFTPHISGEIFVDGSML